MEYRAFRAESVASDGDGKLVFLVTPFGKETTIGDLKRGGFREEVGKGCFVKTLQEGDPLMVYQHDLSRPLARKSAGNLDLAEGELDGHEGLVGHADPADTSYARDLRALVKAKVVTGMSFGFNVIKDEWRDADGQPSDRLHGIHRVLREVQLIEVSPVTRPAYGGTAISARDEASALLEERAQAAADDPEGEQRAPKPYGNVPYADPKNGKYPIDSAHVKAAWSYINQKKNAAKYPLNGVTLASVKARIKAAMKKFGHSVSGEKNSLDDFYSAEWRDDDPYLDDFYEIDADPDDDGDGQGGGEQPRSEGGKTGYARMAAVLSGRSEADVKEVIDLGPESFCVILRDDPDGQEYAAMREAITALEHDAPDIAGAISTLRARLPRSAGEPDTSTPDAGDEDLALRMAMRSREIELDTL